jgi:hypothetical protein
MFCLATEAFRIAPLALIFTTATLYVTEIIAISETKRIMYVTGMANALLDHNNLVNLLGRNCLAVSSLAFPNKSFPFYSKIRWCA